MHCIVCNYTLIYAHLNGIFHEWGVIATMDGLVCQPPWTFRPSCYVRRLPIDTCLVSKKIYKSPLTNYDFGVAMGGLLLKLQNFKKVKLIFGHPVFIGFAKQFWYSQDKMVNHLTQLKNTYPVYVNEYSHHRKKKRRIHYKKIRIHGKCILLMLSFDNIILYYRKISYFTLYLFIWQCLMKAYKTCYWQFWRK